MSRIIAGHFEHIENVEAATRELAARGFQPQEFASYYLNPPGQHGILPTGGDTASDEGARGSGKGAVAGAAAGGAVGMAVGAAVAGPVGALAGAGVAAYVGSLAGALSQAHDAGEGAPAVEQSSAAPGGPMIAVCVDRAGTEAEAFAILDAHGARAIQRAEGEWRDGGWQDFDPRAPGETLKKVSPTTDIPPEDPDTKRL